MSLRPLGMLAAVLLTLGLMPPATADQLPDPTNPTAVLDIDKSVSSTEVGPGDSVTYTIQVGCSAISDVGCRDAITTDVIPEPFVIDTVVPSGPNSAAEPVIDGQNVTVTWTEDIGAGAIGMLDNTTAQVAITVHVPDDVPYDYNGVTVTNEATAEATNATDVTDSADVTIVVPLDLATSATKVFTPDNALAAAGTAVSAALTGTNDSNATVDTLSIQDPTDPTVTPNPFTYLGFTGFGTVTPPPGTTSTTYEVYIEPGGWTEVPADYTPPAGTEVLGTRVTFNGEIPPGATGSVDLDLETTDEAAALPETTTITNNIQSEVTLDGDNATGPASDDFTLQANTIDVTAGKTFDPDLVIAGDTSTATLTGTNASPFAIDTMTITEPSSGSFPDQYTFAGIGPVTYPANATSATVTYQPSGETVPVANGEAPAPPSGGNESVTSFSIEFEGEDAILPGAQATVPFDVQTDPDFDPLPSTVNNEILVEGDNDGATGEANADDDLYIYDERIEPYVDKQIRPSQIIANPGEIVTVTLQGGTTERPNPPDNPDGSTGNADVIVIQDPTDPIEGDEWWNAFDLEAITQTPIPADASLTVYYYDTSDPTGGPNGDGWKVLTGPVPGPDPSFNYDVPDDISEVAGGVRFEYTYTGDQGGFPPGTDLAPNFTASLRPADDGRYESPAYNTDPDADNTFLSNCAQTDATSPNEGVPPGQVQMSGEDCPEIEILPIDGDGDGGAGDLIDKEFGTSSSGGLKAVIARSGDTIPSTLFWSTGGYSGFEHVEITDVSDPENTPVADSVYDAFNLVSVAPITPAMDPYLTYDQITDVLLWDGTDWTKAANDTCPAACDGTFPGTDLTAAEQESTLAVQLVYVESPTRADRSQGDFDAPPVGSGVARSLGNDRQVELVWQVRDERRSDGEPALADILYNLDDEGVVRNTVNVTGFPEDGDPVSDNAFDDVVITDVPITLTTAKDWLGGPLAVPTPGTPEDQYPRSRMRITTTNTTPAKVDQMQITDPAPGSTDVQDPFEYFTLVRIAGINVPDGTTTTTVDLTCADGTTTTYTREEALALTPAELACVTDVQVLFDGRIVSGGQGVLALDMQLRSTTRTDGTPITAADSPIANTAASVVADVDEIGDCPPPQDARYACAQDPATIELQEPTFGIEAGKTISPAQQFEGDYSPVTVNLTAQNNGSARAYIDTITDDDPTFWNAVDFLQMDPSWTLPQPVEFVQACYLSGGDFTAANVEADTVGGTWTCQDLPDGVPPLPGTLTLEEARAFINDAAATADIHGLEFNFMAGSEAGWQNPINPLIQVPFQVERRVDLRTGGPVPTTRSDQTVAPGEENAGIFIDTVEVSGVSVLVGPDERLDAQDTADAPYTHEHLTVGVDVDKTPSGEVQPGVVIPYTITYTNTGDSPLTNPVFTDVIPTDADGPQLIFDPDATAGSTPYTFELEGDAPTPPNGDPLPTTSPPVEITETPAGNPEEIVFTMPEGSVLEPGQTYTITIEMMLRPGLTPDDVVTNTGTIIADEPFDPDNCTPNYDEDTGECWDDTSVSPIRVAALSTVKRVKADVPVDEPGVPEIYLDRDSLPEGTDVPDDYCDTAGDADGFYRAPCVPVTYPGDTETWRFTITNTGTIPLDQVVSMDNLPYVGDTGIIVDLPRETEWPPTFVGGIELITSDGTELATMSTFYSTDQQPCADDLEPLETPCPDGAWLPYDESVDPADVASLKFVIDFPVDPAEGLFDPGEHVMVQFQTRTTPTDPSDSSFPVAWNTVATGGVSNDNGTRATVLPTEGRKVGVTYLTGSVELQKIVTGPGAQYAPDTFTVQLVCTLELEGVPPVVVEQTVELTPGADPTQIDGLPWGAECTATETDQGQTSEIIGTATVGGQDDIELVSIENVFELGDLSVTKSVTSDAVDQNGDPITYGPFQVAATCEFLGEEVWAEGYDADNPMQTEITDGETWDLTGLPVGAECTITEPDQADAVNVVITPDQPVEVALDEVVEIQVENVYTVGSLYLLKEVEGDALDSNPQLADGPFAFDITCTLTDASHPDGTVVYDDSIVLPDDDNVDNDVMDYSIDDLPTGAVCEVDETDDGGATTATVDPTEVTIGTDDVVEVTATNTFEAGSMTVTKQVDSDAIDADGNPIGYGPFEVAVDCTYEGEPAFGTGYGPDDPMVHTIADGETWTIDGLPIGAECTTSETDDADAVDVVIEPEEPVTIGGEDQDPADVQAVTVTNSYDVGSLHLVKEVEGDALDNNPVVGEGPFTLHVTCTLTDASHPDGEVVYDADVVLEGEQPLEATIDNIATGAVCDITETDDGGATDFDVDPDQVTIGADTTVEVTATNTFEVGDMSVTKVVDSDAIDADGNLITYGPFQVAVRCTFHGDPVVAEGYDSNPMTFQISDGDTINLTDLPVGSVCVVTEPDNADAADVDISPRTVTIGGEDEDPDEVQAVTITNTYGDGSLHLRKVVLPEEVEEFPISEGPFTLHVTCTLTDASHPDGEVVYDADIVLEGPQPLEATIDNIAAGAVCVVTEPDPGAANAHFILPRSVTVRDDRTVNVVAVNLFGRGALTVTKAVKGPGAELYGAGPFEVSLTCTYTDINGEEVPLDTPGGPTRELSADNDYTAQYAPLLFGSTCQIEETATGGATSTVITNADGEEVTEFTVDSLTEELQLDVTNTFDVGRIRVKKQVVGDGPSRFTVKLSCTYDVDGTETKVDIPGGAVRDLTPGNNLSTVYEDLPAGAECELVETDDGGAKSTTIRPNDGDPTVGVVTVKPGAKVQLDVVNKFPPRGGDDGDDDGDGGDDGGFLPGTGSPAGMALWLIAGLALLVGGFVLVGRGRLGRRG